MTQAAEDLLVRIDAQTEQLRRELRRADETVQKTGQSMERRLNKFDRTLQNIDRTARRARDSIDRATAGLRSMNAALGGLAIGAAVTQFGRLGASAVQSASQIEAAARTAGVGVEEFQRLSAAAEDVNIQQDALQDGLKELQIRTQEFVRSGAGPAKDALQQLTEQSSLTDQAIRRNLDNTGELFRVVLQNIQQVESQAARTRIFDELFGGQAGEQFIRFLDLGADGVRRIGREAEQAGRVLDKNTVSQARRLENEFQDVGDAVQKAFSRGTIQAFGEDVGNISKQLNDEQFQSAIRDIGSNFGTAVKDAKGLLSVLSRVANSDFAEFIRNNAPFANLFPDFSELGQGNFGLPEASTQVEDLRGRIKALQGAVTELREEGRPVPPQMLDSLDALQSKLGNVTEAGGAAAEGMRTLTITAEPLPGSLFDERTAA